MIEVNPGDTITYTGLDRWPITVKIMTLSHDGATAFCKTFPFDPHRSQWMDVRTATLQHGEKA